MVIRFTTLEFENLHMHWAPLGEIGRRLWWQSRLQAVFQEAYKRTGPKIACHVDCKANQGAAQYWWTNTEEKTVCQSIMYDPHKVLSQDEISQRRSNWVRFYSNNP